MAEKVSKTPHSETKVSVEEVEQILELGRLLLSVLTTDELEELGVLGGLSISNSIPVNLLSRSVTGNTSVT